MQGRFLLLIISLWTLSPYAWARDGWSFETLLGDAHNFDTHLKIQQGDFTRTLTADYKTHGFQTPLYYSGRMAHWNGDRAWELQLIHHKLYLNNPPTDVESLSVSHGFNIVTLNHAWDIDGLILRAGVGPVVTHAEARVNGVVYDGPYELSGAAVLVGAGKRVYFGRSAYVQMEAAATAAYTEPRAEGAPALKLSVSNIALHGMIGIGIDF